MHRSTHIFVLATLFMALGAGTALADRKKQHRYVGIHPIPKAHGSGLCYIEGPHVHVFAPTDVKVQYREHDGAHHFVGDPVAYGYDGPKHAYYGHHPVPVNVIVEAEVEHTEYCYLDGPHFHHWAPPPGISMELRGGAYWYVGKFPRPYVEARAVYDPIDVVYTPIVYTRPAVVVDVAPPGWYGLVVAAPVVEVRGHPGRGRALGHYQHGGHAVVEAGVHVVVPPPPTVRLEVGLPSVHVGVGGHVHGGGGVIVGGGGHRRGKFKHKKFKGRRH